MLGELARYFGGVHGLAILLQRLSLAQEEVPDKGWPTARRNALPARQQEQLLDTAHEKGAARDRAGQPVNIQVEPGSVDQSCIERLGPPLGPFDRTLILHERS